MKKLFKAIVAFFKRLFGPPSFAVGDGEVSVNPIKEGLDSPQAVILQGLDEKLPK